MSGSSSTSRILKLSSGCSIVAPTLMRERSERKAKPAASVRIPKRMFLMPGPGGSDDVLKLRILRFPAQVSNRFFSRGHQLGGIARAAWFFEGGDFFAGDFFAHADDFAH